MPRDSLSRDFPIAPVPAWCDSLGVRAVLGLGALVLVSGCQSSGSLAKLFPKPTKPSKTIQSLVKGDEKPGLPQATKSKTDSATLAKSLDAGQAALAKYYQETSTTSQQAHLTEASRNYQEALAAEAGNPEAHHGLAIVSDLRSDFDTAEVHYRAALEKDPDNSAILGDLGYSFLMQGKLTDAETFLRRATQEDPGNIQAVKNLAVVYGKQGQYNLAESTFRRVLNDGEVQQEMVRLFPQGRPDVAESDRKLPWTRNDSPGTTTDALKTRLDDARQNSITEFHERQLTLQQHTAQPLPPDALKVRIAQLEAERDAALRAMEMQTAANTPLVIGPQGPAPGMQIQPQPRSAPNPSELSANSPLYPPRKAPNSLYPNGVPNQNPNNIQQASSQSQPYGPNGQRPIEQALHQTDRQIDPRTGLPRQDNIQQTQGQSGGMLVPNTFAPPADQPGPGIQEIPPSAAVDRFEEAKRRAALVGMGGPEMMFPVVEGTQRLAPGTGSTFNGGQYPAPERFLPTNNAPHDLNQLLNAPSGQFTVQPNSQGQLNAPTGQTFQNPNFGTPLQPQIPIDSPMGQTSQYQDQAHAAQYQPPSYGAQSYGVQGQATPSYDPRANINNDLYRSGTTHQYNPSQYNPSANSQIASPSTGIPVDYQAPRSSELMAPWTQQSMTPSFNPPPYSSRPAQNEAPTTIVPEFRPAPTSQMSPSPNYYSEPAAIYEPGVQIPQSYHNRGTASQVRVPTSYGDSNGPRITPSR